MTSRFIEALQDPKCFSHPVDRITWVETHISWVVLTGRYVYKIKKPVQFPFVDFSTLEKRRWFCEEEVRLNRRLAPQLYLGVVPITGTPSDPCMDGEGTPFEYAVQMKQFPDDCELHKLLSRGKIDGRVIRELAHIIGEFHGRIESAGGSSLYGEPDVVWGRLEECFADIPLDERSNSVQHRLQEIRDWTTREWENIKPSLIQRKASGKVRECHGDLHLGNIALFENHLCIFDALEFEPQLRWIDVISEVAFLVMDLESKKRGDLAYWFLTCYLEKTGDYGGMGVFRLYELYRALVRAKVAGLRLMQVKQKSGEWENIYADMIQYVRLAHRLIHASPPTLVLMHGVSGTGKTTVSNEAVKTLGAVRVRSDVERKRLSAEKPKGEIAQHEDRKNLYTPAMTQATYDRLLHHADTMLKAGYSVVVDAAFLHVAQREPFACLAHEHQCRLVLLDVWAPEEVLVQRLQERSRQQSDASDATVEVMKQQKDREEPLTEIEQRYAIRIDSSDFQSIQSGMRNLIHKGKKK